MTSCHAVTTTATFSPFLLSLLLLYSRQSAGAVSDCEYTFRSSSSISGGGLRGSFSSPNHPHAYPANQRCIYRFEGRPGQVVWINWTRFHLEQPMLRTNQCLHDYVEVIVTDEQRQQHISGRYCGSRIPPPLKTMQRLVVIDFRSSFTPLATGFAGNYQFIDEKHVPAPRSYYLYKDRDWVDTCGGRASAADAHNGLIVNPGYPGYYPPNITCNWLIRVERGKKIYIRLLQLNLTMSLAECHWASLHVIDGYRHEVMSPGKPWEAVAALADSSRVRFCGTSDYYKDEGEKSYLSNDNRIIIKFTTTQEPSAEQYEKHRIEGTPIGFKLLWTEVETVINEDPIEEAAADFDNDDDDDDQQDDNYEDGIDYGQKTAGKESLSVDVRHCQQFACRGGEYCLDDGHNICATRRELCIDKSLVCNGHFNCAENDDSDEQNCYSSQIIIGGTSIILILVLVILITILYQRHVNSVHVQRLRKRQQQHQQKQLQQKDLSCLSSVGADTHTTSVSANDISLLKSPSSATQMSSSFTFVPENPAVPMTVMPSNYHSAVVHNNNNNNNNSDQQKNRRMEANAETERDDQPFLVASSNHLVSPIDRRASVHRSQQSGRQQQQQQQPRGSRDSNAMLPRIVKSSVLDWTTAEASSSRAAQKQKEHEEEAEEEDVVVIWEPKSSRPGPPGVRLRTCHDLHDIPRPSSVLPVTVEADTLRLRAGPGPVQHRRTPSNLPPHTAVYPLTMPKPIIHHKTPPNIGQDAVAPSGIILDSRRQPINRRDSEEMSRFGGRDQRSLSIPGRLGAGKKTVGFVDDLPPPPASYLHQQDDDDDDDEDEDITDEHRVPPKAIKPAQV